MSLSSPEQREAKRAALLSSGPSKPRKKSSKGELSREALVRILAKRDPSAPAEVIQALADAMYERVLEMAQLQPGELSA